ncbi:sulfite exporter TauE/SafE family protein [Herbaspirillum sp. ST 5-3]|uniref:sulfite exporter TauE/SafE family protein n=1 Tax=Oxalobacteraceae TaxID=75682 RepID=UPI0010A2AD17|nr:sulfite exporter TauE/SafE family protein [Herbaspirillum sp. ST 5-3]
MLNAALLFLAALGAAAVSGSAGFGGALLLLPLLVKTVGVTDAVPLLTIAQLIGNLSRAALGFTQIRWRPVAWFLLGAIPFSILGAQSFLAFPKTIVTRCIGAAILLFLALKMFNLVRLRAGPAWLGVGGGVVGCLSGLVGSAGPLGAAVFLALGLPPVAYVASEATTALAMHGVKMLVYGRYLALDRQFWFLAGLMGIAMVLGTWLTKRIVERIPRERFQKYVALLLAVLAAYMLVHG